MADAANSLPIRTENDGDVVVKVGDATIPSQQLAVNSDGSVNITDNGGSLTVDGSVELGATTLAALESTTVQNGAGASAVNVQDGGNSLTVDGTVELGATTLAALESITVQNGSGGAAVNVQDGGNSLTVDGTVTVQDGGGSITVDASDLDIRNLDYTQDNVKIKDADGDALAINVDGSINVNVTEPASDPICDQHESDSVAKGDTVNHDYTVTALKTFSGREVIACATGALRVEVFFNTVLKFVAFTSVANPTAVIPILGLVKANAGEVVRVAITNLDSQTNVYSTLLGEEV